MAARALSLVLLGVAACGTFGGSDSPDDAPAPSPSATTGHRDAGGTSAPPDASGSPAPSSAPADAASDALVPEPAKCNLSPGLRLDFTLGMDPRGLGWYRSDTLLPDAAGLVAPDQDGVSRITRCAVDGGGPSFDVGMRIVYRMQVSELPDCCDPVRVLDFGSGSTAVRLTFGSGENARVAQLDDDDWGYVFDDYPDATALVTSFRRVEGVTYFCGAARAPGDDLTGVCGQGALQKLDAVYLPDRLDFLEIGLPPNAQSSATISTGLEIDAIPP